MKPFPAYTGLFLLVLISCTVAAQSGNKRCRYVKLTTDQIILDSLSVVPGSVNVSDVQGENIKFEYNFSENSIQFKEENLTDSVLVCYRVFNFNLTKKTYLTDPGLLDSTESYVGPVANSRPAIPEKKEELFSLKGLNTNGNITRGISFGNTQNVFVNSSLNLQMEGRLTKDIGIKAVFSDQNVPFQPEGNTQQLQEFDRVFVQLQHKNARLSAGDIILKNKPSEFLQYYKNVQGGSLETNYQFSNRSKAMTSAAVSVSKGKFNSMIFDALQSENKLIEGVQGPYRLRGAGNERFIVVQAGSEKIFLDGKKLERGFDYDYVIDYNLAEVTFNPKIIITQFTRIRVDFEYADDNYARSIIAASHYQNIGKFEFNANFYRERDNPRNPVLLTLTDQDKQLLSGIGDTLSAAVINGADSVGFDPNRVLYLQKDTLVNAVTYTVFEFSSNAEKAVFDVVFTDLGQGNGNYIQKDTTANGRVFEWTAPILDQPQGRYEPVRVIATPKMKQMITLGAAYNFSEADKIFIEGAFSNQDINLFSDIDNSDNTGGAVKMGYENQGRSVNLLGERQWTARIDFEMNNKDFEFIDRRRPVDFNRDWGSNTSDTLIRADDYIFNAGLGINKGSKSRWQYDFGLRKRAGQINGTQHRIFFGEQIARLGLSSDLFILNNKGENSETDWKRLGVGAEWQTKSVVPGYAFRLDRNQTQAAGTDSVISTAMNYLEHRIFIKSSDSIKTRFLIDYALRTDDFPDKGTLLRQSEAHTAGASLQTNTAKNQFIGITMNYRTVSYFNSFENLPKDETVTGRVDWNARILKNHIRSELVYTTAGGRELKREFIFLPVPAGEGTHTWRDDNKDGVQDLNEFYLAVNPDEKNYAKFFIPTDEYIRAFTTGLNYRLNITGPRNWRNEQGFKQFISKWSSSLSWNTEKRSIDPSAASRINPVPITINNEDVLSLREAFRTDFFYNRSNPKFGVNIAVLTSRQKQLLTNGFEITQRKEYTVNTRRNIAKKWNLRLKLAREEESGTSDFLISRNYLINGFRAVPELAFQPTTNFRISGLFSRSDKENVQQGGGEKAALNEYGLKLRWVKASARSLDAGIRHIRIKFSGAEDSFNSPVGYIMLDALRPGSNWTWNINFRQRLSNGLQISINYDGRKSPGTGIIHLGRMQVSALF